MSDAGAGAGKAKVEADRLSALYALGVLGADPDPSIDIITRLAAERFKVRISLVSLVDHDRQWFMSRYGLEAGETSRSSSICSHAIDSDKVMVVLDATADARFAENPLILGDPFIRFYAGAPLILNSGHRVGTLCIIDSASRTSFGANDREVLALMARQVVGILEGHRAGQEQRISQLISQTTSDAFVCSDAHGRIILWNRAAQTMFGWSSEEAVGKQLDLIIPGRHRSGHNAGMKRLLNSHPPKLVGRTVEVPARCRDGKEVPVELSLAMWPTMEEGTPEGYAAIMRDISARKKSEAQSAEQLAALDASNDGIAITDVSGNFVYLNKAHAKMFGYKDPADLVGQNWTLLYNEDEKNRILHGVMPILASQSQWRGETRGRARDGSSVHQEISLSLSAEGGMVCVTRDIGRRLSAERETIHLREQLTEAQRQQIIGQLISGIAHDFNNFIVAIAGSTQLLRLHADSEVRRNASRIHSAAETATALVEKMLTLGQRKRTTDPVDLRKILYRVRDLLNPSLFDTLHTIEINVAPHPVMALADETEVAQVIMNLALNGRKALPENRPGLLKFEAFIANGQQPCGPVVIGSIPKAPAALIRVSDTGCGIPEDVGDLIFRPFFSQNGGTGTGLGLAVVASIIDDVGGAISVASQPQRGTVFEIWWPLELRKTAQERMPGPTMAPASELAGKAVLLVDDDHTVLETLSCLFEDVGAEVGPCLHPSDAITALRENANSWDLLITDFDMPGMDGAQLAKMARTLKEDLPVLLLTGLTDVARLSPSKTRYFDAILKKPASFDILERAAHDAFKAAAKRKT
jgi:PAS domain S-box-containing protein